jgi:hypothetical protein
MKRIDAAIILSLVILTSATIASAGGLLIPDLYRDNTFIKRAWFGSDVTTLFLVIPSFVIALIYSMRGSLHAKLILIGLLGYMLYNFAFYLFGATFNRFFLIYVLLFTMSIYALILNL